MKAIKLFLVLVIPLFLNSARANLFSVPEQYERVYLNDENNPYYSVWWSFYDSEKMEVIAISPEELYLTFLCHGKSIPGLRHSSYISVHKDVGYLVFENTKCPELGEKFVFETMPLDDFYDEKGKFIFEKDYTILRTISELSIQRKVSLLSAIDLYLKTL